jgi:hypothetical protein
MNLRAEIIEQPDAVPSSHQLGCKVQADKAEAAGDQYGFHLQFSLL